MDNKHDILTKIFYDRLKDYQHEPEVDSWKKLEQKLSLGKHKPKIPMWQWAGAAASIAIILTISAIYFFQQEKAQDIAMATPVATTENGHTNTNSQSILQPDNKPVTFVLQSTAAVDKKPTKKNQVMATQSTSEKIANKTTETDVDTPNLTKHPEPTPTPKEEKGRKNSTKYSLDNQPNTNLWVSNSKSSKKMANMLALSIGNSGSNLTNMMNQGPAEKTVYNYDAIKYASGVSAAQLRSTENYELANVDYKTPLTVGMYFRKHFSPRFALESGISYTYLSSREYYLSANAPSMTKDIKLHYLGIPIKAIWSAYEHKRFSCYVAGGGSIEKCILGKETTSTSNESSSSTLSVPELQFSVTGGIGLDYKLVNHLSIFVEPGVGYFFDDNSDVRTIRKKTPFTFQVQGGLRMTW